MRKLFIFSVVFTITGLGAVIVNGRPFSSTLGAPVVLISEEDGDPISRLRLLQVPNDSLTDAGGGILSLDTSSGDANAVDVAISTTALQALIDSNIVALAQVGIDTDTLKGLIDNNAAELVAVGVSTQALQDAIDSGFDTVGLSTQTNADNILTNAVDISTVNIAKVDRIGDTMTGTLIVPQVDVTTTSYQEDTGGERAFSKIQISAGSSNRLHTRFDFNEGAESRAGYMVTPLGISSTSFQGRLDYAFSACDPDEFDCDASPFGILRLDMRSGQKRLRIGTQFLDEDVNGDTCAPINLIPGFGNVSLTLDDCFVEDDLSSKFTYQADAHTFTGTSGSILLLSTTVINAQVPLFLNGNNIIDAGQIDSTLFIGPLNGAASENVLKAGDTMTGNLDVTANISLTGVIFSSGTGDNVMLGNLGINGTTTLGSSLTVNAASLFTGTHTIPDDTITTAKIADDAVTSAKLLQQKESLLKVSGGVMTSDGTKIGINEASPNATLEVKANLADQFALQISSQNGTAMFFIDREGQLGPLKVNGNIEILGSFKIVGQSGMTHALIGAAIWSIGDGSDNPQFRARNRVELAVDTGDVVMVQGGGDVGINTTLPIEKLHVQDGVILSSTTTGFGQITVYGSLGGCVMMRDTDNAGWTQMTVLNGVVTFAIDDGDGVCD